MKKIFGGIWDYIVNTDKVFWLLTISASIYSLILISSMQRAGEYNFFRTQLIAVLIGYTGAIILSVIDYEYIISLWWIAAIFAIVLASSVFLFGIQVAGTDDTAWIRLPGGITFQPSELIKILFVITFAKHLSYLSVRNKLHTFGGVITLIIHALIPVIIIHEQGDDGAVLIFVFVFIIMSFTAGVQLRYFIAMLMGVAVGIPLIWNFFLNNEHRNRILALFDLDGNALTDYGWQQYQGKVSIASGQLKGYGLNGGMRVEYGIVPEQENDFIFTVAGEEFGFIGCIILLGILLLLCMKIIITAKNSRDCTGAYICYGVFAIISVQTIINIGMVLGMLPVIGITLPFFSAGGTSAMCLYLGIGLVQSVYMHNNITDLDTVKVDTRERVKI